MVQNYCLSFGGKVPFFKRNAASFKGFLHNLCRGIACWKKAFNFLKGKLQKTDKCFFASRGGFIVAFDITFRMHLEQECNMLNSCYIQKHLYSLPRKAVLRGKSCIFEKNTWYFARDSGKVHAISMVLRFKLFQYLFLNCVYLKWSFTFWLWGIYYIAFNKGNTIHTVTFKQKIWLCMEIAWN